MRVFTDACNYSGPVSAKGLLSVFVCTIALELNFMLVHLDPI